MATINTLKDLATKKKTPLTYTRLALGVIGYKHEFVSREVAFILGMDVKRLTQMESHAQMRIRKVLDRKVYSVQDVIKLITYKLRTDKKGYASIHNVMQLPTLNKACVTAMNQVKAHLQGLV